MKGSIAAINREARERGMSYRKYLAFRAAQKAPASSREGETTAEPKRSMPPGASLGLEEPGREQAAAIRQWETGKTRPKPQSQRKIAQAYGLEPAELERTLEEAGL